MSEETKQLTSKQRAIARATVGVYRRRGVLVPKPCAVCGIEQTPEAPMQMHHFDYSKPLHVIWLCHKHHKAVHRGDINCDGLAIDAVVLILREDRQEITRSEFYRPRRDPPWKDHHWPPHAQRVATYERSYKNERRHA